MRKSDITPSTGNVFADLGLDAPDELLARAALMPKVAALVSERKLTQKATAKLHTDDYSERAAAA